MDKSIYDNYVYAVADQGSLTAAARSLGITQPALSSGLNTLEKNLGFKVFNRRTTPVSFTPEGEIYFDYIKRAATLAADMKKRIECLRQEASGKVTVGGPVAYAESLIADAVHKLLQQDSSCRVSVKSAPLSELIEMATGGEIDCFVSTSSNLPDKLEVQFIKQEKIYLCVPGEMAVNQTLRTWPAKPDQQQCTLETERECSVSISKGWGSKLPVTAKPEFSKAYKRADKDMLECLNKQPFVFLEEDQPLQKAVDAFLAERNIEPVSSITVNQVSTAVGFAARGEGLCFATEEALAAHFALRSETDGGMAMLSEVAKSGCAENTPASVGEPDAIDAEGKAGYGNIDGIEYIGSMGNLNIYELPKSLSGREIYVAYDRDLVMTDACRKLVDIFTM